MTIKTTDEITNVLKYSGVMTLICSSTIGYSQKLNSCHDEAAIHQISEPMFLRVCRVPTAFLRVY